MCLIGYLEIAEQGNWIFSIGVTPWSTAQRESLELVEVQVRNSFRAQHMIPDQHKTSEVVAIMVETGGAQVSEVFSMKR